MKSPSRPLAVLVLLFLASGSMAGVCAGWQGSAEARLACCQDEAHCPMHATKERGPAPDTSVSQVDADRCCASAERGAATPSSSAYAAGTTLAVSAGPIPAVGPDVAVFRETPVSRVPIDLSPVPRHLLLSVFLI